MNESRGAVASPASLLLMKLPEMSSGGAIGSPSNQPVLVRGLVPMLTDNTVRYLNSMVSDESFLPWNEMSRYSIWSICEP